MGLFPKEAPCPNCGHQGALVSWFSTRCRSRGCVSFDPALLGAGPPLPRAVETPRQPAPEPPRAAASGIKDALDIVYTNHRGEVRTFTVLGSTVRQRGRFLSFQLVEDPKLRISLALERIDDLDAIEPLLEGPGYPVPEKNDKQVLSFHLTHRSTSPRFEALRGQYGEWIEDYKRKNGL